MDVRFCWAHVGLHWKCSKIRATNLSLWLLRSGSAPIVHCLRCTLYKVSTIPCAWQESLGGGRIPSLLHLFYYISPWLSLLFITFSLHFLAFSVCHAMLGGQGQYRSIRAHAQLSSSIRYHSGRSMPIREHAQRSSSMSHHAGRSRSIRDHAQMSSSIR